MAGANRQNVATISDFYKDDLPDDSIFVFRYPTCHNDKIGNSKVLVNSSRYLTDDKFYPHLDVAPQGLQLLHQSLPVLGPRMRACVTEEPPTNLIRHWQRRLGIDPPRFANLGDAALHVCLFPLEDLAPELHAVDPDEHYHVHSKAFIAEIDCPQAAVLKQLKLPAVLKVCRSMGGFGTWMINTQKDYKYRMTRIKKAMPYAETVLTDMIPNIKQTMCCHMYLSRKGDVTWIAVTEQIMDGRGKWTGSAIQMSHQEESERVVRGTTEPVAMALHARGYFGMITIDVLVDYSGRQYVVDINPRISGSMALILTQRVLHKLGRFWEVGKLTLLFQQVKAESVDVVVSRAEAVDGGEVILYSLKDGGNGTCSCVMAVFAPSVAECSAITDAFCEGRPQPGAVDGAKVVSVMQKSKL